MRKHTPLAAALALLTVLAPIAGALAASRTFQAHLSGDEEVPPVETRATGQATFQWSADSTEMSYRLIVANIENVRAAHIHHGAEGVNGPVIVTLYSGPTTSGRTQGVLAEGTITADDLRGPLDGMSLSDLAAQIEADNTYVNVHTDEHPDGEIRGQIDAR